MARTYRQAADQVGYLSFKILRSFGMSEDAFAARGRLYNEEMMKSTSNNCTNIAVLLQKYMNFCKRLTEDADPRLKQWITCKQTRQSPCPGGAL
jgi:hypothetical protein